MAARRPKKLDIELDLINQLERNGAYGNHYLDLIKDYMSLWTIKKSAYC